MEEMQSSLWDCTCGWAISCMVIREVVVCAKASALIAAPCAHTYDVDSLTLIGVAGETEAEDGCS